MTILAVDDERRALDELDTAIRDAARDAEVVSFQKASEALAFARENRVDTAFLDIEMSGMDGLTLAKNLKNIYPATNIIFVTAFSTYTVDAFGMRVSGYVMKPIDPRRVREELDELRHPVTPPKAQVYVKCFGSFGVFVNGEPLPFTRSKSKELLAYLVHKQGATVSSAEIASVLWENREYNRALQSLTQKAIGNMTKVLEDAGAGGILKREWNNIAVNTENFACDYYAFLKDRRQNTYQGEYMNNYSWAETTLAYLNSTMGHAD